MNRKQISIDDLAAAIEWMQTYDRVDDIDAMADALLNVVAHLQRQIADQYAADLKRETIADLKAEGKTVTSLGKIRLNDLCRLKGEAHAARIVNDTDRGSLLPG